MDDGQAFTLPEYLRLYIDFLPEVLIFAYQQAQSENTGK